MKLFTQWRITLLSALFSLLGIGSAWAQLTHGKVYNFANVGQTGKSLIIESDTKLIVATTDAADTKQHWYAEEVSTGVFALRNMHNGKYLKSPNATGNASWTTVLEVEDNCKLLCEAKGTNYTFRATNTSDDHHYLHYSSAAYVEKVVCWNTTPGSSQWTFTEVAYDADVLGEILEEFDSKVPSKIATNLAYFFEDVACTKVKSTFTSEAEIEASAAYKALPDALRNMVKKVYNQSWTENNYDSNKSAWDNDYAKKYRVQWYEPYTEPECAASALRINAHTNLNNPTGIFANSGDVLFVMVEGEIKEGAYLYLSSYTGHGRLGGYRDGTELHTGLNIIPVTADGTNYCINYVVKTFDTSKGTGKKAIIEGRELSNYPDLQIHIEGGYINGYWNKMGDNATHNGDFNYPADDDADWNYIKERATQTDVTVLGEYVTLQFPLTDAGTGDDKGMATFFNSYKDKTTSLEASIEEWDNVMIWERLLMGVLGEDVIEKEDKKSPYSDEPKVTAYTGNDGDDFGCDYSEYYRVHGLSFGTEGGYMYGGWDHCGYNFNTMESVMLSIIDEAGPHWGPAHEIGHQHQGPLNMRGLTEVTNNLFSNVVLWYFGKSTSRYNGTEGSLSNVLQQFNADGTDFFSNNIWAQTIMYYKLFLYYHVLGHNPKFYPRLFEMLRQNPMAIEYNQDGGKCLMHFYKLCCDAAGEDLTEFFRAHGFFEVMDNRLVGDYSNSVYTLTQAQIDAAIKEVKAQAETNGWKENIAVLFITDATGETIQSHKGDDLEKYGETTICAEVGCYANFNSEPSNYTYSISGCTVTMEGTGGVGFAILNENGELLGFSDKKTFNISAEAAAAIASGKASIVTFKGDNTPVEATNIMDAGSNEAKYELLGNLLDDAKALLDLTDETGTKVGYYRTSALTDLQTAYTTAKGVYDEKTVAAYSAVYDVLFQEYANLMNNDYARVNITEGYAYRLTNKAYPDCSMAVNTANNQMFGIATAESDAQLWYFEPGTTKGTYYLKNKSTQKYPGDVSTGAVLSANKSEEDKGKDNGAYAYNLQSMGNGIFALVGSTGLHCSASQSYNIVGWGADANATQWYITATALDETLEARTKLEELVGKTEALINEVGTVEEQGVEPITLTADAYYCNARCINTQWDKFSSYSVLNDGNIDTYLHTDYSGDDSEDGYAHYIRMDVGESSKVQMFKINYTTRNYLYPTAPTSITVEGSNDLTTWEPIETNFTEGLPTDKGTAFTTPAFGNGIKYRYIRLVVNSNDSNQEAGPEGNKHKYFALSELGISKVNYTTALNATYNTINSKLLSDLYSGMLEANGTLATSSQADGLNAAYTTLYTTYKALLDAKTGVEKTALTAKKAELQTLINKTKALIGECGSVVNNEETTPQLNITAAPYLLTDNNGASRGSLDKLYDGLQGEANSYTSNWESTPTKPSYLQVDLGTGKEEEKLIFTFTNRNEGDAPTPTEIVVSASADGNEFTELATFTSAEPNWPPAANKQNIAATKWTSPEIKATSACRYWRFTVTKSQRNSGGETNANGIYHFGISEFGIVIPAGCKVTVNEGMGGVTKELLLATYDENQEAQSTHDYATTEVQVDKAIANLQAQYDALEAAKNVVDKSELASLIETATTRLGECGTVTPNGDVLDVTLKDEEQAGSVNKNMLRELYRAIEDAQGVIANTKATQEEVNAEIAELTAQIEVVQTAKNSTAKADLKTAIDAAQTAINACASSITQEGGEYTIVWNFETAGDVDKATLIAAYEALVQANAVYNGEASTVSEYQAAKEALGTPIATLNDYKVGYHKSQLKSMVDLLTALIEKCNTEGLGDLTTGVLEEMVQLNETATAYLTKEFATQEVLVSTIDGAISNIETNYPTWSAAQQSTAKTNLLAKIAQLAELIDECGTVTEEGSEYVATLDPYAGVVTEEQLIAAYRAKVEAETLANNSAVAADLTAKKEALQTVYNELHTAKNTNWLPVTLTRDINNPVLYTFKSARGTESIKTMQYDPTDAHSFSIVDKVDSNAKQAYFFMMGDTRDQVYVYPYAAAGMVIAADDTSNGANKVFASEKRTRKYEQWTFVEQGDWYNLRPVGTSTYLSHFNGGSNKIGFYSSNPNTDDGSRFQFEEVEIEGSSAYHSLKVYYDEVAKIQSSEIVGGDGVGYYPVTEANAYNTAYATAHTLLNRSEAVAGDMLTAAELCEASTTKEIAIKCVQESNYTDWVEGATGYNATFGESTIFNLEPVVEGESGAYYLKALNQADGYFQNTGYSLGSKEQAQVFVPVQAVYRGGSGNTAFAGDNADTSGASDLTNLVRFICGSSEGTTCLNPQYKVYNEGRGVWTVFNVYAVDYTKDYASEDDYLTAYRTLRSANEALVMNMPEVGKYYKIVSVSNHDYCNTALAYANENNGAQFSKDMTSTNARAVWEFIPSGDGFHVRNLHTDSHIGTLGWGAAHTLQEETAVVKIEAVNGQGLVKLINGQPMHAQETNSVIVGYPGNLGSASIWSIQEVDIDDVTYPLTITQFGYAGLHLNYPVELPDGLTAYTIYSAEGANGIARMRPISGNVVPANTGVIIEGKQGNYDLNYQAYEGEKLDNLLLGSNYTRYVKADDNTDYFVFAAKKQTDGSYKVGLYITWEEFDANGSTDIKDGEGNVTGSNKGTHYGGYFKSSANKIFLPCSNEAGAAKFFFQRDSDITDIDSLLNGLNSDDEVYDLQGRRISKVTKEGIYIVNGQKRYLKATKF